MRLYAEVVNYMRLDSRIVWYLMSDVVIGRLRGTDLGTTYDVIGSARL